MKYSRLLNLVCILVGGGIAIYAQAEEKQNQYILIAGIVLLMFGLYRMSRTIPSKYSEDSEPEHKNQDDDV